MPLGKDVGLGPGDIVLDGEPSLPPKGAQQPPIFGPCNVAKRLPLGREVDLGPGDNVFDWNPAPPKGHCPEFWAHVCCGTCGQTAGWIKMPLGADCGGLGPAHIELDGDRASPKRGHSSPPPLFGPCIVAKRPK